MVLKVKNLSWPVQMLELLVLVVAETYNLIDTWDLFVHLIYHMHVQVKFHLRVFWQHQKPASNQISSLKTTYFVAKLLVQKAVKIFWSYALFFLTFFA